ncbi:uncharacterized protein AMSG_08507 [Thecamonas trahens ATCC 50062]|uniref:PX domain-containing protein n=1 Tax=Thecamonas trahens ATCC 50062 TaxID=461836 RepID=A0A0L0DJQ5_THETB|nr:hypothetical protein AMSG_08507 [Thecamonas trahens ATCC 50062]KNC52639.1 hypothetical protein AMSG_08507 [Thecamonas trahens ATCC 50062]|eukprot:XP_013755191.1 hypothetical protein AMSG_08507 [Thecamonas trahens ATCC 50062]
MSGRSVAIPLTCNVKDELSGVFTLYEVHFSEPGTKSWAIQHRYSTFRALRKELMGEFGKVPVLAKGFPGTKLFNNTSPSVIEERRAGLETWLEAVVELDSFWLHPAMVSFSGKVAYLAAREEIRLAVEAQAAAEAAAAAVPVPGGDLATQPPTQTSQRPVSGHLDMPGEAYDTAEVSASPSSETSSAYAAPASVTGTSASTSGGGWGSSAGPAAEPTPPPATVEVASAVRADAIPGRKTSTPSLPPVRFVNTTSFDDTVRISKDEARSRLRVPQLDEAKNERERLHALEYDRQGHIFGRTTFQKTNVAHMAVMQSPEMLNPGTPLREVVGQYQHVIVNGADKLGDEKIDAGRAANNQGVALVHLAAITLEFDNDAAISLYKEALAAFKLAATFPSGATNVLAPEASRVNIGVAEFYYGQALARSTDSDARAVRTQLLTSAVEILEAAVVGWEAHGNDERDDWGFAHVLQYRVLIMRAVCAIVDCVGSGEGEAAVALRRHVPVVLEHIDMVRVEHDVAWVTIFGVLTRALDVRKWGAFKSALEQLNRWHAELYAAFEARMEKSLDADVLSIYAQLLTLQANNKQFDGGKMQERFAMMAAEKMQLVTLLDSPAFVFYAGHLYKKGRRHKTYKRRGFLIDASGDLIYADSLAAVDLADPNGRIPLAAITSVEPAETPAKVQAKLGVGPATSLHIVTAKRVYECVAHAQAERDVWMANISRAMAMDTALADRASLIGVAAPPAVASGIWDFVVHIR